MSNVYWSSLSLTSLFSAVLVTHSLTYTHALRPCNDWKWNKNRKFTWNYVYQSTTHSILWAYDCCRSVFVFFFVFEYFFYNFKYYRCYTWCCRHQCCCRCRCASCFTPFFIFRVYVFLEITFQAHVRKKRKTKQMATIK